MCAVPLRMCAVQRCAPSNDVSGVGLRSSQYRAAEGADGASLRRRVGGVDLAIGAAAHTALVEMGRLRCAPSENGVIGAMSLRQLEQPERRNRREHGAKHGGDAEEDEGADARGVLPYLVVEDAIFRAWCTAGSMVSGPCGSREQSHEATSTFPKGQSTRSEPSEAGHRLLGFQGLRPAEPRQCLCLWPLRLAPPPQPWPEPLDAPQQTCLRPSPPRAPWSSA